VQVVGYLQSVTDKIDIDLVTLAAYEVGGSQVLVPQRIEPARRVRAMSDAQVSARQSGALHSGSTEFRTTIADLPVPRRDVLTQLADWADALADEGLVKLATFHGKSGITTLLPRLATDDAGLVSISCDARSRAYMQLWRSVFERRAPSSIPAVEAAIGAELKQGTAVHQFPITLLDMLSNAYREGVHGNYQQ
jgi:hypothetical protein